MDEEWVLSELRTFETMTTRVRRQASSTVAGPPRYRTFVDTAEILKASHVVEQIVDRVVPDWRRIVPLNPMDRWRQLREAAQRAIVEIERRTEVAERLGDGSPTIRASGLHPWVWDGARSLWQSGHLREAVRAASVMVNAETQTMLGRRDVSETTLFQQAYSSDSPQPGQPRLRPAGDDGGKTALSVRRGGMALAEGLFAAVRNPASHDPLADLDAQDALEQLAAWSVLARLVHNSTVETR